MAVELFENRKEHYFIIKDGDSVLKLTADEFQAMRRSGTSPLLTKLWHQAKKERQTGAKN